MKRSSIVVFILIATLVMFVGYDYGHRRAVKADTQRMQSDTLSLSIEHQLEDSVLDDEQ